MQVGLQQYSLRRAISTAKHDVGALVLYLPRELPHAWPWDSVWTAVLDATSQSSDGGGSKLQATSLGATMRLRSGQLGLGELDYARDGGADSVAALASVWRSGDSGARLAVQLQSQLEAMAGAIATPARSAPGDSELQRAIAGAQAAVTAMATPGMPLPATEEWRGLRAVVSGALPRPSRREQAATRARAAVVQSVAPPATGGRDADRLSAMQIAARAVTAAARAASRAVCETAARWRKEHAPAWRGGAAGELDGDDDDDLDDDGDDEGDPVPEEEPTDDEGAGEEWDRRQASGRGAGSGSGGAGRSTSGRGGAGRGTGEAGASTAGERRAAAAAATVSPRRSRRRCASSWPAAGGRRRTTRVPAWAATTSRLRAQRAGPCATPSRWGRAATTAGCAARCARHTKFGCACEPSQPPTWCREGAEHRR